MGRLSWQLWGSNKWQFLVVMWCGDPWLRTFCVFMCMSQRIYKNPSHLSSVAGGQPFIMNSWLGRDALHKKSSRTVQETFLFTLLSLPPSTQCPKSLAPSLPFQKTAAKSSSFILERMTPLTDFDVTCFRWTCF